MNVSTIQEELLRLPTQIADEKMDLLSLDSSLSELRESITLAESKIKSMILAATDEAGKKLYSNEESRKNAFISECETDRELISLYASEKSLSDSIQRKKIQIELLADRQRNLRTILPFFYEATVG